MRFLLGLTVLLLASMLVSVAEAQERDLALLFEEPTEAEIVAVWEAWRGRDVEPRDWQVVGSAELSGMTIEVVSHEVADLTHYGLVRYPADYSKSKRYPVLILNHGGTGGTGVSFVNEFMHGCFRQFFVIAPSFRGESIDAREIGLSQYTSDGEMSVLNHDVDDALAFLEGVIANYDGAYFDKVSVYGSSRGASVSYLMSARSPRIARGVYIAGSTDHITFPQLQETITADVVTGAPNRIVKEVAKRYLAGELPLADARATLIGQSVIHFIDALPANLQLHHGRADEAISVEHSRRLDAALRANDLPHGSYDYFEYEGVAHRINEAELFAQRNHFLCAALQDVPEVTLQRKGISAVRQPY